MSVSGWCTCGAVASLTIAASFAMSMNDDNRLFKVLVVGASGAGKSCLLLQFADGIFIDSHVSTIGVDFKLADVQRPHPVTRQPMPCKLQIWDTAGQERFRTITNSFYRGAQATIVVFDVSDEQSLHAVPAFVADAKRFSPGGEATRIYLVANKCDRAEVRHPVRPSARRCFSHGRRKAGCAARSGA